MSKFKQKIGWQKYEDFIEKQLSSPILGTILQNIAEQHADIMPDDEEDEEEDMEDYENLKEGLMRVGPMIPISNQLIEDISILSSFECWIGHTNFDITLDIKDKLNKVPGIELLKICSRYRFFVGIGQMFDFQDVRNDIEKAIIEKENDDDRRVYKHKN